MQEIEANRQDRNWLAGFEESLPKAAGTAIARKVRQGVKDIDAGHYREYDAAGLRGLAKDLVAASSKKRARRSKAA